MFFLQVYGSGFITLMIPLAMMTMGFGFTNVGATTFALQSAEPRRKGTKSRDIARVDLVGTERSDHYCAAP